MAHYQTVYAVNKDIEYTLAKRYALDMYRMWLVEAGFEIVYDRPAYYDAVEVIYARKIS